MKQLMIFAVSATMLATGCAQEKPVTSVTPLQLQAIQSRDYEDEKSVVFASVVSVFQDLGYTIQTADLASGFINATSAAQSNEALKIWFGVTQVTQTKATGFVEAIGNKTRVRLNFVASEEQSTVYGASDRQETPLTAPEGYQNAFERIENAIFVRRAS